VAAGYIGWEFYRLNTDHNRLINKQSELEAEKKRLEPILKKKADLQREKELLDRKINIIKELKSKQRFPVQLLDELSRNMPEYVWLTSVSEDNLLLRISGSALNANKVADFVDSLQSEGRVPPANCGHFCIPPDGQPSYSQQPGSVTFTMTVQFQPEQVQAATPTQAGK